MIRSASRAACLFSLPFLLFACNSGDKSASAGDPGLSSFSKDSLAAAIKVLASDEFQGRRPFTAGETKTIDYLVNAYTALGLEPGNGNGYTQDVPMVEISPAAPSSPAVRRGKRYGIPAEPDGLRHLDRASRHAGRP